MWRVVALLLAAILAWGREQHAQFSVSYGFFSNLGTVTAHESDVNGQYRITIGMQTHGAARVLSRNRQEQLESIGRYTAEVFVPDRYIQYRTWSDKAFRMIWLFDHTAKKVRRIKEYYEGGKLTRQSEGLLSYYQTNDLLSLF